ncbi:hypothetical protein MHBO_005282 [Bonamia ostreae]|uniref:ATP synthase F0 subunit 8 n=1 Tax=Bonamia ostreae TaxID=126728 RepID=A0ABV2AH13_9EUKA
MAELYWFLIIFIPLMLYWFAVPRQKPTFLRNVPKKLYFSPGTTFEDLAKFRFFKIGEGVVAINWITTKVFWF